MLYVPHVIGSQISLPIFATGQETKYGELLSGQPM